ncbi:MAG: glycosyltransferase family 2 protein [Anaerolineae bacterium]|nr:glycosyltransferase family 2 protein [Anaerolineae bacterium]
MARLSIVFCNYNTRDELANCLESIRATRGDALVEIIVVDNASSDGSAAMVRARFPEAALIANAENRFFARANNQGIAAARGEYVCLLNADIELTDGALPAWITYLDAYPEVGALGCKMVYPDGRTQRVCARFSQWADLFLTYSAAGLLLPGLRRRREDALWYGGWDRESARAVDVIPNSCTVIRRAVLEQVGGLDERFNLYFTEEDWCRRAKRAGWSLRYIPEAVVIHIEGASTRKAAKRSRRMYYRDMLAFSRKYFGAARTALLRLALLPVWAAMRLRGTL